MSRTVGQAGKKPKKDLTAATDITQMLLAQLPIARLPVLTARIAQPTSVGQSGIEQTRRAVPRTLPIERRPAPALPTPPPTQAASQPAAPPGVAEVAPAPPASFTAQLPEDPMLRVNLSAHAAAISIQTADAGDLSLYLRMRPGSAELRIAGAAAPTLERHADALRVALATEGIVLARLEVQAPVTQAHGSTESSTRSFEQEHRPPPEPIERPEPAPTRPPSAAVPSSTARPETGLHVRA